MKQADTNADRQAKHRANNRTVWTFTITDPAIAKILDALKTKHGSDKAAIEHALKGTKENPAG